MSYKKLEIWQMARELLIDIHKMTLTLPSFEMYEEGRQIRKSNKSVKTVIIEGYGRKNISRNLLNLLFMGWAQMMKQLIIWKHYLKQVL